MILNLQNEPERVKAKTALERYLHLGKTIELTEKKNTRSTRQNKALHLMFTIISQQLNEMGIEYQYTGISGKQFSIMHTPELVKSFIWKPLQLALFNEKSTTKINTEQINQIVDVIAKFFAERGVVIEFPSKEQLETLIEK